VEISDIQEERDKGRRAEEVAVWFLRLNGVFAIQGFIVHPDRVSPYPLAEADVIGIRMNNSFEGVHRSKTGLAKMPDHEVLTKAALVGTVMKSLALVVEVKASLCRINGPWSEERAERVVFRSNMERVLGRIGCFSRQEVVTAAEEMNRNLRYEGQNFVAQYFAIGDTKNLDLAARYPRLVQLTFGDIATFLHQRFRSFPEKIVEKAEIDQWPGFGDRFRRWFFLGQRDPNECVRWVRNYIAVGP